MVVRVVQVHQLIRLVAEVEQEVLAETLPQLLEVLVA
tara:strand:- start:192 stop:302 length:111 start_codon:yes stop_codon:yes gene_type:complete